MKRIGEDNKANQGPEFELVYEHVVTVDRSEGLKEFVLTNDEQFDIVDFNIYLGFVADNVIEPGDGTQFQKSINRIFFDFQEGYETYFYTFGNQADYEKFIAVGDTKIFQALAYPAVYSISVISTSP